MERWWSNLICIIYISILLNTEWPYSSLHSHLKHDFYMEEWDGSIVFFRRFFEYIRVDSFDEWAHLLNFNA